MVDPHTNGCPDPEVLAAYVDRGLSLSERARVDAHLASCPQCIALVAGVVRTVAELSAHAPGALVTTEPTPLVTWRAVAGAVAAAAAVIAVVSTPLIVRPRIERDSGLVSLVESVGEQRSVLGRLTGGFPHAPLGVPSAGGQDGRPAGADRVQLTAGKIRESFGERQTPSQLHAVGLSQLLAGHYDDAAQALMAASREQPANAQYLSDVAAVQLERARLGLRPDDLPRALAAADRARRLDPSLREAWFNRALAASALSLREMASASWSEYLKRDSASAWAAEARARIKDLAKPTIADQWPSVERSLQGSVDATAADAAVRAHLTEARRYIETQLLPAWASAEIAGLDDAARLDRIRVMADAMLRVGGDALYVDTVNAIDRASRDGKGVQIAQAHQQYAAAASLLASDQFARAIPALRQAKASLDAIHSPYAVRPSLDLAALLFASGAYAEGDQVLADVLKAAQQNHYAYAEARVAWIQGLAAFAQGRLGDAQVKYEDALSTFARMGDQEQTAAAHNLLGALFGYIGDDDQALSQVVLALRGLEITRSEKLRHGILMVAATSIRASSPEAALAIEDEAVRNAEQWGFQMAIAEARALRATILTGLGRGLEADRDLAVARQQIATTDSAVKSRLEITILLTESQLLRAKNPAAAADAATKAIAMTERRGDRSRLPQLELALANANIVWGRAAEAELALQRGIDAFELERSSLVDEGRASSRDEAWQLFETSVHLAIEKHDYERAFALAERARTRSLAEARKLPATRSLSAIRATLRDDEAIVALNQFDDEFAVWVVRRDGFSVATRKVSRATAERLVSQHQDEIRQQSTALPASRALYNEILRPLSGTLANVKHLVMVPDTTYQDVSFAALPTPSGGFLIESIGVNVAPSANAFASLREHPRVAGAAGLLVFGGAAPEAVAEARTVADAYPSAAYVGGTSATKARFFADAQSRSILHLAVPIATSNSNPLLSRVIVSDEPGVSHSGMIFGKDIATAALSTNLVVIDKVEIGPNDRSEGTSSVARAFMAAGVPAVVGTLPGADESATRDLMIAFHREMSKGVSAEQALQTVQRNAIEKNGRRVGAWSALVLYGSDR